MVIGLRWIYYLTHRLLLIILIYLRYNFISKSPITYLKRAEAIYLASLSIEIQQGCFRISAVRHSKLLFLTKNAESKRFSSSNIRLANINKQKFQLLNWCILFATSSIKVLHSSMLSNKKNIFDINLKKHFRSVKPQRCKLKQFQSKKNGLFIFAHWFKIII